MKKKEKKELELAIRAHAQAMYDWGLNQEDYNYWNKIVVRRWKLVKSLLYK